MSRVVPESLVETLAQGHLRGGTLPHQVRQGAAGYTGWHLECHLRVADRLEALIKARQTNRRVWYQVAGTSNDVTTCECCGRANLKKTVVVQLVEDGAVMGETYLGSSCAVRFGNFAKFAFDKVVRRFDGGWQTKPVAVYTAV